LDEKFSGFDVPPWPVVAYNGFAGLRTLYKLPTLTGSVQKVVEWLPHAHVLWMVRHPYAVVASMRTLQFGDGQCWLERYGREELASLRTELGEAPDSLAEEDLIAVGANIWKHKVHSMHRFMAKGMSVTPVRYEDLVEKPEATLREALAGMRLDWSDNLLEHHKFHGSEPHAGNSRGDVPIDRRRKRSRSPLSASEKAVVSGICGAVMRDFGYDEL
jgi:hypothetical protein